MACGGEEGGVRVELGQVHLGGGEEPAQDVGRVCQQESTVWKPGGEDMPVGRLDLPLQRHLVRSHEGAGLR